MVQNYLWLLSSGLPDLLHRKLDKKKEIFYAAIIPILQFAYMQVHSYASVMRSFKLDLSSIQFPQRITHQFCVSMVED